MDRHDGAMSVVPNASAIGTKPGDIQLRNEVYAPVRLVWSAQRRKVRPRSKLHIIGKGTIVRCGIDRLPVRGNVYVQHQAWWKSFEFRERHTAICRHHDTALLISATTKVDRPRILRMDDHAITGEVVLSHPLRTLVLRPCGTRIGRCKDVALAGHDVPIARVRGSKAMRGDPYVGLAQTKVKSHGVDQ